MTHQTVVQSNEQIRHIILQHLASDSRVNAQDIRVEVDGTTALLSGSVPSYADRRHAAEDVLLMPGITAVNNQITVQYAPQRTLLSDDRLQSHITELLRWNARLRSMNPDRIRVQVNNGIVTLEGSVDAYWQKLKAEDLSSEVFGVRDLHNTLAVVPTEHYTDESIARTIIDGIHRALGDSADRVTVTVAKGIVTLSGTVASPADMKAVRDTACHTEGALYVHNDLSVQFP